MEKNLIKQNKKNNMVVWALTIILALTSFTTLYSHAFAKDGGNSESENERQEQRGDSGSINRESENEVRGKESETEIRGRENENEVRGRESEIEIRGQENEVRGRESENEVHHEIDRTRERKHEQESETERHDIEMETEVEHGITFQKPHSSNNSAINSNSANPVFSGNSSSNETVNTQNEDNFIVEKIPGNIIKIEVEGNHIYVPQEGQIPLLLSLKTGKLFLNSKDGLIEITTLNGKTVKNLFASHLARLLNGPVSAFYSVEDLIEFGRKNNLPIFESSNRNPSLILFLNV